MAKVIAPKRGEQFVDPKTGVPLPRPMSWIEQSSLILNSNFDSVLSRLDKLEPQYVQIDATDSPYTIAEMDYVECDMSAGDVSLFCPATVERFWFVKNGDANTLTLNNTIGGEANPEFLFNNTARAVARFGGDGGDLYFT